MNKVYLGLSILEISKTVMYDFWYHYVKPKHREKAGLCYMDTDRFIVYIKSKAIYLDIAKNFETKFDISNYELGRLLPKSKNKRVNGLMKDELGWKKMTEFATLKTKTNSYLTEDNDEDKKEKSRKKCDKKRKLKFEDYKHCLEAT